MAILELFWLTVINISAIVQTAVTYYSQGSIIFPDTNRDMYLNDRNNLKINSIEAKMVKTASIVNASQFFNLFEANSLGDEEPFLASRKKVNYVEQAICKPDLKVIKLDNEPGFNGNEIYFPKCIRVPRCGGCCDLSERMTCVPVKTSFKEMRRARIRSSNAGFRASSQLVKVEIHDECKCVCKIKASDCLNPLHDYEHQLCQCVCKNSLEEAACHEAGHFRLWDFKTCSCKCRYPKHCSSGFRFNHKSCR